MIENTDDLRYWYYDDVISEQDCDAIVTLFSQIESIDGTVNDGDINKTIRNVKKIQLPTYKSLGGILTAVGMNANQQRWNFDIQGSKQCELLMYLGQGRYKGHIDTVLSNQEFHRTECRKLTVLAFLNNNFDGGKFFLSIGPEKIYPPQEKGTILVFPSFLRHGVEDVTEGVRYSAVCWMVGPWFK